MTKKLLYIPLLCAVFFSQVIATEFNFAQELRSTNDITDTLELIAAYQSISQQVQNEDSTRLAKKLVKLILNLHTICCDENDTKIRLGYKNLLEIAIANEKLSLVDYTSKLPTLLESYITSEPIIEPEPSEPEPEEEVVETSRKISLEEIEKLYKQVASLNTQDISSILASRKIVTDLAKMTRDLKTMQTKISRLSEQDKILFKIYEKLNLLEKLMKENDDSFLGFTRLPIIPDEDSEYSPLLQRLIAEDADSQ